jgi:acetoin utilization deacetylase AcuC-like enzyme
MGHHALYYSDQFVMSKDSFDTTRKAAWVADSLRKDPVDGIAVTVPHPARLEDAARIHSPAYLNALRTGNPLELAESPNIVWDQNALERALSTCGGMIAAGRSALKDGVSGCLASGFHHARRDRGLGYCTLNGLAIAAHTLAGPDRNHILILDLDAHCGGGTHSLIKEHPRLWQIDVSVNEYDRYQPGPRCMLQVVTDARRYLQTVWQCLQHAQEEWPLFALCLYNAGMDIHQDCANGGLAGMDEFIITLREEMVFRWCNERGIPVAYALAGGYTGGKMTRKRLVGLHRVTVCSA